MARHAGGAGQVVVVVDVAIGALTWRHRVRAHQWEAGRSVVECRIQPGAGAVALLTGLREIRRDVIRIGRALKVIQVAGYAGRARQVVVVVDVAIGALARRHRVQSGQRKSGAVVIEGCVQPGAGAVALLASLREIRRDVIRIRRALEILQVTGHARRTCQVVVVVDVAIGALARRHGVQSGQLKPGSAVIEDCVQPGAGAVALLTSLREIRGDVIRIRRALKILQVAGHAGRARQVVVVIDVAIGALARRHGMQPRQCKSGSRVIELAIGPSHRVMTLQTGRRETGVRHGADRGVVILLVAADAGCGSNVVVVVDVAIRTLARRHHVRTRQRETRLGVIKSRRLPGCRIVTSFAGL